MRSIVPGILNGETGPFDHRLKKPGKRAIFLPEVDFEMTLGGTRSSGDRAGDRAGEGTGRVRLLDYADYGALDRYDAVVHHGGPGIAQAALAAGLP